MGQISLDCVSIRFKLIDYCSLYNLKHKLDPFFVLFVCFLSTCLWCNILLFFFAVYQR